MIPIGNKRIERENYKIRQKFVSEVFIDFSKKCYGNEYYFNKVSYYFGNGHPCITSSGQTTGLPKQESSSVIMERSY